MRRRAHSGASPAVRLSCEGRQNVRPPSLYSLIRGALGLALLLVLPSTASAQYCTDVCSQSTSCSTNCYMGTWVGTCGDYGVCGGYPPPSGDPSACSNCNVYSRCDQQCTASNPYNQTCSQWTECGWCQAPKEETTNYYNTENNCTATASNSYGDPCYLTGWNPGPTPYCSYQCQLPACWNLR